MAIPLEEIFIDFGANFSKLDASLDAAVARSKVAAQKIDAAMGRPLTAKVDDRQLTALNAHLDLKKKHYAEVQTYINTHPITPKFDDHEVRAAYESVKRLQSLGGSSTVHVEMTSESKGGSKANNTQMDRVVSAIHSSTNATVSAISTLASTFERSNSLLSQGLAKQEATSKAISSLPKEIGLKKEAQKLAEEIKDTKKGIFGTLVGGMLTEFGMGAARRVRQETKQAFGIDLNKIPFAPSAKNVKKAIKSITDSEAWTNASNRIEELLGRPLESALYKVGDALTEGILAQRSKLGATGEATGQSFWEAFRSKIQLEEFVVDFTKISSSIKDILSDAIGEGMDFTNALSGLDKALTKYKTGALQRFSIPQVLQRAEEINQSGKKPKVDASTEEVIFVTGGYAGMSGKSGARIARQLQQELPKTSKVVHVPNRETDIPDLGENPPIELIQIARSSSLAISNLRGYTKDAVEMAAQALAAYQKNPAIKIKLLGESGGGFVAEEASAILKQLGIDNVEFLGAGTPKGIGSFPAGRGQRVLSADENLGEWINKIARPRGIVQQPEAEPLGATAHKIEGYYHLAELASFLKAPQLLSEEQLNALQEGAEIFKQLSQENPNTENKNVASAALESWQFIRQQLNIAEGDLLEELQDLEQTFKQAYISFSASEPDDYTQLRSKLNEFKETFQGFREESFGEIYDFLQKSQRELLELQQQTNRANSGEVGTLGERIKMVRQEIDESIAEYIAQTTLGIDQIAKIMQRRKAGLPDTEPASSSATSAIELADKPQAVDRFAQVIEQTGKIAEAAAPALEKVNNVLGGVLGALSNFAEEKAMDRINNMLDDPWSDQPLLPGDAPPAPSKLSELTPRQLGQIARQDTETVLRAGEAALDGLKNFVGGVAEVARNAGDLAQGFMAKRNPENLGDAEFIDVEIVQSQLEPTKEELMETVKQVRQLNGAFEELAEIAPEVRQLGTSLTAGLLMPTERTTDQIKETVLATKALLETQRKALVASGQMINVSALKGNKSPAIDETLIQKLRVALLIVEGVNGQIAQAEANIADIRYDPRFEKEVQGVRGEQQQLGVLRKRALEAISALTPAIKQAADAGNETAAGFIGALQNALPRVEQTANRTANQFILSIKRELGIASPSKVMQQVGMYLLAGFEAGINEGQYAALGQDIGIAVKEGVFKSLGIHSPADTMIWAGQMITQGIVVGVELGKVALRAAMQKLGKDIPDYLPEFSIGDKLQTEGIETQVKKLNQQVLSNPPSFRRSAPMPDPWDDDQVQQLEQFKVKYADQIEEALQQELQERVKRATRQVLDNPPKFNTAVPNKPVEQVMQQNLVQPPTKSTFMSSIKDILDPRKIEGIGKKSAQELQGVLTLIAGGILVGVNKIKEVSKELELPQLFSAAKTEASEFGREMGGFFSKIEAKYPVFGKFKNILVDIAQNLFALFGAFTVGDMIASIGIKSAKTAIQMTQLQLALNFSTGGKGEQTLDKLRDKADKLGTSLLSVAEGYKVISAATFGTSLQGQTEKIVSGFVERAAAQGSSGEQTQAALTQVAQSIGKTKVQMEELVIIAENMPGVMQSLGRALGMTTQEMYAQSAAGNLLADQVFPKLAQQLSLESAAGLVEFADSPIASINRLNNTITNLQAAIGKVTLETIKPGADAAVAALKLFADNGDKVAMVLQVGFFTAVGVGVKALWGFMLTALQVPMVLTPMNQALYVSRMAFTTLAPLALKAIAAMAIPVAIVMALKIMNDNIKANVQSLDSLTAANKRLRQAEEARRQAEENRQRQAQGKPVQPGVIEGSSEHAQFWDPAIRAVNEYRDKVNGVVRTLSFGVLSVPAPKIQPFGEKEVNNIYNDAQEQIQRSNNLIIRSMNQVQKAGGMDAQIKALQDYDRQIAVTTANLNSAKLAGNLTEVERLQKVIAELQTNRQPLFEQLFGTLPELEQSRNELKKIIEDLEQRKKDNPSQAGTIDEVLPGLKEQYRATESAITRMNQAMRQGKGAAIDFALALGKINAAMEDMNFADTLKFERQRSEIMERQSKGLIGQTEAQKLLAEAENSNFQDRLNRLEEFTQKRKSLYDQLSAQDRAALDQVIANQGAQGPAALEFLAENKDKLGLNEAQAAVLRAQAQIQRQQEEVEKARQGIANNNIQLRDLAKEQAQAAREMTDSYRDLMKEMKDQLVDAKTRMKELLLQLRRDQLNLSIAEVIAPGTSGYMREFIESLGNFGRNFQAVGDSFLDVQRALDAEANRFHTRNQQILAQQRQNLETQQRFNNYVPGGAPNGMGGVPQPTSGTFAQGAQNLANAPMTSPFGMRNHPVLGGMRMHTGMDFGLNANTPLSLKEQGQITGTGFEEGYGNWVELQLMNGTKLFFAHLNKVLVQAGQKIDPNQVFALSGNTGRGTGAHLHLEAGPEGKQINPAPYVGLVQFGGRTEQRTVATPVAAPISMPAAPVSAPVNRPAAFSTNVAVPKTAPGFDSGFRGLDALIHKITQVKPDDFNMKNFADRVRVAIAAAIAGTELTGSMSGKIPVDQMGQLRGGPNNQMLGPWQFDQRWHAGTTQGLNNQAGFLASILTGRSTTPTGSWQADYGDELGKLIQSGAINSGKQLKQWLSENLGGRNWQGLTNGWGRANGLEDKLFQFLRQSVPASQSPAPVANNVVPFNRPTPPSNTGGGTFFTPPGNLRGLQGINNSLMQDAPNAFNLNSPQGRARLAIALGIAGTESTDWLRGNISPAQTYNMTGGANNNMRGPFQFNQAYWAAQTSTRQGQNQLLGQMLSGQKATPDSKQQKDFGTELTNAIQSGMIANGAQLKQWMSTTLGYAGGGRNWQGLSDGWGRTGGLENKLFEFLSQGIPARQAPAAGTAPSAPTTATPAIPAVPMPDVAAETERQLQANRDLNAENMRGIQIMRDRYTVLGQLANVQGEDLLETAARKANDQMLELRNSTRGVLDSFDDLANQSTVPSFDRLAEQRNREITNSFLSLKQQMEKQAREINDSIKNATNLLSGALDQQIIQNLTGSGVPAAKALEVLAAYKEKAKKDLPALVELLGQIEDKYRTLEEAKNRAFDFSKAKADAEALSGHMSRMADLRARNFDLQASLAGDPMREAALRGKGDKIRLDESFRQEIMTMSESLQQMPGLSEAAVASLQNLRMAAMQANVSPDALMEAIRALPADAQRASEALMLSAQNYQLSLNQIAEQSNWFKQQIQSGLSSAFETLFQDLTNGTKTMGQAFMDFGRNVLQMIAKILLQLAAMRIAKAIVNAISPGGGGGIASFLGFANGGEVPRFDKGGPVIDVPYQVMEVQHLANGGMAESLGFAVMAAMQKEGPGATPIVAHAGEHILTDRNGDAQFYRALERSGKWMELKRNGVDNFASGGLVGSAMSRQSGGGGSSGGRNRGSTTVNVNNSNTYVVSDVNDLKRSERQRQRDSANDTRRAYERFR